MKSKKRYYSVKIGFAISGNSKYTIEQLSEYLSEKLIIDLETEEVGSVSDWFNQPDDDTTVTAVAVDWSTLKREN